MRGFTIVELLIVIVVIAILAAISIVAYNGIQDRTRAAVVQNDLTSAKKKLMLFKVDKDKYPIGATLTNTIGISATKTAYDTTGNNFYYCYNTLTDEFAIGARSISNKAAYVITSSKPIQQVSNVDGNTTCQAIGLTTWDDANGWISNGYTISTTTWQSWTSG